uniref:Uncharacterized protein n=1 Tax=Romanomermis culicivorax TaxID=13658 RepID=A0A915KU02_ROMCU
MVKSAPFIRGNHLFEGAFYSNKYMAFHRTPVRKSVCETAQLEIILSPSSGPGCTTVTFDEGSQ